MIDLIIVGTYLLLIVIIGVIAARKNNDKETFAVAGRDIPIPLIVVSLSALLLYQNNTLGTTEKVFLLGISQVFALFGYSLKEILVAKFIAPNMNAYSKCLSIGDIAETHYGKIAKFLTGLLSLTFSTLFLSILITAFGYFLNIFFEIEPLYGIITCTVVILIYTSIGGIKSLFYTQLLHFIMIIIALPIIIYFGIHQAEGWSNIASSVPNKHLSFFGSMSFLSFISLFFSFMLAELFFPPYIQRLLSNRNTDKVSIALLISGLVSVVIFILTGIIGIIAYALVPTSESNMALPELVISLIPTGFKGITIIGILAIIISSAESFLNAGSVSASNDIIGVFLKKHKNDSLILERIFNILIGTSAACIAIFVKDIGSFLVYPLLFWAPIFLVPLIAPMLGFKTSKSQLYQGALAGIIAAAIWTFILANPFEINGLIIGVLANLSIFLLLAHEKKIKKVS